MLHWRGSPHKHRRPMFDSQRKRIIYEEVKPKPEKKKLYINRKKLYLPKYLTNHNIF